MFSFTRQERQVIIFLASVALAGLGANFLIKKFPCVQSRIIFSENTLKADLNKANKDDLAVVPGIGEKLAQRIIEYRAENDRFSSLEDLKEIKGITDNRYKKLKEVFTVK